jgi:thioredoxin 2
MDNHVVQCPSCGKANRVPAAATGTPRCAQCHTALPWVVDAGVANYTAAADDSPMPVLVDLWAPWCGPCRAVSPALEQLAQRYAGRVKLVKVNVDEAEPLALRFQVRGIPTLLVMNHGKVIARQTGAAPEDALRRWLDGALAGAEAGAS